ncbi:MAG: hypothetical protein NXI10_00315 [bacterium]|nr:hypothetical protein [bacterium]
MKTFFVVANALLYQGTVFSQEEKTFDDYYSALFDTTLNDSAFLEVLLPFYDNLRARKKISETENIGETYEYYEVTFEDSLILYAGQTYVVYPQHSSSLFYLGDRIIHHDGTYQRIQEIVQWTVADSTVEKKFQAPIPVLPDTIYTLDEIIYNPTSNIKVSFTIEYQPSLFGSAFLRMYTLDELSHSNRSILRVKNVQFSDMKEGD